MHLYNLTLQKASAITHSVYGNFSGAKQHEIVVSRAAKTLELLRPDENGKVQSVCSTEVFGVVRSIAAFRLTGAHKDYIVVGSDSGRIVILDYNAEKNRFDKVHQETYGKSGCRRIVPGQFLAVDPKGRACMIAAAEKQKLVYVFNRDSANALTISSPLEAHKTHTLLFHCVGVDVGFDNPIFGCIEFDYTDTDQWDSGITLEEQEKVLTYYELDLGLNHVIRKWSQPVDQTANLLVAVPGGKDGPGGVLVCSEGKITYQHMNHDPLSCPIPRRADLPAERETLIVTTVTHKQKDLFFMLLQSEYGDVFKVTLDYKDDVVQQVQCQYFDTLSVAMNLCILRTGFLFAASEFGNHAFYQFSSLGDDNEPVTTTSASDASIVFVPSGQLRNLVVIDEMDSVSPVTSAKWMDLANEGNPQLYTLCGRAKRSTLRALRHGLAVQEMAVSELPGHPTAVWTVKTSASEEYDRYLIVSFSNGTLVLSVGETVEEVTDSGFLVTSPTLGVTLLGQNALVQVHPNGIRHIQADQRISEWKTPGKMTITKCAVNNRQVVVALSEGELIYFELDSNGNLSEVEKKELGGEVACLALGPIPQRRVRSRYLAVADYNQTVKIFSLDPSDCMQVLSMQALADVAESACLSHLGETTENAPLYLNVGLRNGLLMRTTVDPVTGQLSDTRTRFLGTKPVRLFDMVLSPGTHGLLALSSRPWLCYRHLRRITVTPLSYSMLEYASPFNSEQCAHGIVAVAKDMLRIIMVERYGETFNQTRIPLDFTPRRFVRIKDTSNVVVIESDHQPAKPFKEEDEESMAVDEETGGEGELLAGEGRGDKGTWSSAVRIVNLNDSTTLAHQELDNNETAISVAICKFHGAKEATYVIVGAIANLTLAPKSHSGAFLRTYKVLKNNTLEFVHKTPVEEPPYALHAFNERLLVGCGQYLRIYDLGKKKLLKKCECKNIPTQAVTLDSMGSRIYVGDLQESFHYVKYKKSENQLYVFADDVSPRWVTCACIVDFDTMAGADKFGNIFICRINSKVSDEIELDETGAKMRIDEPLLNGACHKLVNIANFHVGEVVTSISRVALQTGGREALVYTTIYGTVGALIPFTSKEDVEFFSHLEMHLRQQSPPLCGRDHLSYRSYYVPVKGGVDGDLCEMFANLEPDAQKLIADELDRTPAEVLKKLDDIANHLL
eukprot:Rmarinus@m.3227